MKHSLQWSRAVPVVLVGAIAATMVSACSRADDDTPGDSIPATGAGPAPGTAVAACAVSSDSVRRLTRAEFVAWARTVDYDAAVDSQGRAHGSGTAGITVHRARDIANASRADLADGCVIARIQSASANANLGLGAGWTYVWADSTNPFTATMVPEDSTVPLTEVGMTIYPGEPDQGTVASPRYICSECGNDWCVYPRDGLRSQPTLFEPDGGVGVRDGGRGPMVALTRSALAP